MRLARGLKERSNHASNSGSGSSDRSGSPAVAGKSVYSHAGIHQVNLEWRRGHRRGFVDLEHLWTLHFSFPNSRRNVSGNVNETGVNEG